MAKASRRSSGCNEFEHLGKKSVDAQRDTGCRLTTGVVALPPNILLYQGRSPVIYNLVSWAKYVKVTGAGVLMSTIKDTKRLETHIRCS